MASMAPTEFGSRVFVGGGGGSVRAASRNITPRSSTRPAGLVGRRVISPAAAASRSSSGDDAASSTPSRISSGWSKPYPLKLQQSSSSSSSTTCAASTDLFSSAASAASVSHATKDAAKLAQLLSEDNVLYSDVVVDGETVEFKVVVDSYQGNLSSSDVLRVHKKVAESCAPLTSVAYAGRREASVCVRFPIAFGAVSATPLPSFSSLESDKSEGVADDSIEGLKWLLDQHVLNQRVLNLMEKGSDDRSIFTGAARLGKYYTGMTPLTEATIHRGSCTSSSPTQGAFAAATETAKELFSGVEGIEGTLLADMRNRIQQLLCPSTGTFTFHPSGTDAESVPLLYAILQSRALAHKLHDTQGQIVCRGRVVSIVTCAAEVGSGTLDAARGCYFSSETPLNAVGVGKGLQLPHLHKLANIEALSVQGRGSDGPRDANMEADVLALARAKLDEDPTTVVVMHTVAGSKTGMFAPSVDVMETLVREYGKDRIVGVLDACQMRHSPDLIPSWLNDYGLIMITASKYYAGPSFAGGVLLSNDTVERMQEALEAEGAGVQSVVAKALAAYLTSNEICTRMPALCGAFPKETYNNTGLILRWAAGLYEMETLHAAIDKVGQAEAERRMNRWIMEIRSMVDTLEPQLDRLPVEDYPGTDYQFSELNSIVSVRIRNNSSGGYRDTEELKMVYTAMYNDVSAQMPSGCSEEELELASKQCLVGQPVPIPGNAVLRTCMGGPQMKQLLEAEDFDAELEAMLVSDRLVLEKLAMLGKHFESMFPGAL